MWLGTAFQQVLGIPDSIWPILTQKYYNDDHLSEDIHVFIFMYKSWHLCDFIRRVSITADVFVLKKLIMKLKNMKEIFLARDFIADNLKNILQ